MYVGGGIGESVSSGLSSSTPCWERQNDVSGCVHGQGERAADVAIFQNRELVAEIPIKAPSQLTRLSVHWYGRMEIHHRSCSETSEKGSDSHYVGYLYSGASEERWIQGKFRAMNLIFGAWQGVEINFPCLLCAWHAT